MNKIAYITSSVALAVLALLVMAPSRGTSAAAESDSSTTATPPTDSLIDTSAAEVGLSLADVRFGGPPAYEIGARTGAGLAVANTPSSWLYLEAHATDYGDAVATLWKTSLVVSKYVMASGSSRIAIQGASVRVVDQSGTNMIASDWIIPLADATTVVPIANDHSQAIAALRQQFAAGAAFDGDVLVSDHFYEVPRLAAEVTVRVSDPVSLVIHHDSRLGALVGDDSGYDARSIRVIDGSNNVVMVAAINRRLQWGVVFVDPRYRTDFIPSP